MGLTNRIDRPLTGCRVTAGHGTSRYFLSVTPLSSPYRRSPAGPELQARTAGCLAARAVARALVGGTGTAFLRGHVLRVQHVQERQRVLVRRIGVPVGGAL